MANHYSIAFKGEIAEGHDPDEVRRSFARKLQHREELVDRMFSGGNVLLARNLEWEKANAVADRLRSIGAVVYLRDQDGNVVQATANKGFEEASANDADAAAPEAEVVPAAEPGTDDEARSDAESETDSADESQEEPAIESPEPESPAVEADASVKPPTDLTATAKVRHLEQLTSSRSVTATRPSSERRARWRYRFDTFMARGGTSIFKMLTAVFVATFLLIGLLRAAVLVLWPDLPLQHENVGVLGNFYITFLEITDPGNMAQDIYSSPGYKLFAILAGIAGIVMLSALIAFITTSLTQRLHELKRGRSKVIETGHTLILGWNEQRIVEILRELVIANESEKDACVVILADRDKEEMDEILRLRIGATATTRIVTRSGEVTSLVSLDMVSLDAASSVIVLASCDDTDSADQKAASDARAIQTVLAAMGNDIENDEVSVVVEIFNPTHRDIVRSSFPEHVVTVNTSDILAKLLVQTSRSVGLSVVYNEILSFDGCEMYFHAADWKGCTFGALAYRFPDGVPLGVRDPDRRIILNPPSSRPMQPGDEILILADDDSTIEFLPEPVAEAMNYVLPETRLEQRRERELMIGWSFKSPAIIREFAEYVMEGSEIEVLLRAPSDKQVQEIEALNEEIESVNVRLLVKDYLNISDLMSVKPFEYDNIIILADSGDESIDVGRIDSENIVALLLLRRIFSQFPVESENTKLITEILDSQNDALVAKAGVQDVIISNRLVSMIMAQISESRDIEKVYDDIFQEDGSEIYLKPAHLYFESLPAEVSFADMIAQAQQRSEVCIGVKIKRDEQDKGANNGVTLIPEKNRRFSLDEVDSLVVLAEDEL